jgi:hypothetical protein
LIESERQLRVARRAGILKLALRAFKAERGAYPETLAELTAHGYLQQLPSDPHDERHGFGYRIAPPGGETLRTVPRSSPMPPGQNAPVDRFVPAGQAILWSVGSDQIDQGGTELPIGSPIGVNRPDDLVYLVPQP